MLMTDSEKRRTDYRTHARQLMRALMAVRWCDTPDSLGCWCQPICTRTTHNAVCHDARTVVASMLGREGVASMNGITAASGT